MARGLPRAWLGAAERPARRFGDTGQGRLRDLQGATESPVRGGPQLGECALEVDCAAALSEAMPGRLRAARRPRP